MKNPLISVVIPAHNRKDGLNKLLDSLISQTYSNKEIIVVDDSTPPLNPSFAEIRYIHIPPTSNTKARNEGIRQAKGDIIAFTDDDCIADKDWLERIACHFQNDSVSGVEGKTIAEKMAVNYHATENLTGGKYPTCNLAFLASVLKETGGFDEKYGFFREDTDLAFAALSKNRRIVFAEDVVVFHPPRKVSARTPLRELKMIRSDIRLWKKYQFLYRRHFGRLGGGGVKTSAIVWLLSLAAVYLLFSFPILLAVPLAMVILLKYFLHLRKRIFSFRWTDYIVFSWARDILYPFFFVYYFLSEKGK